MSSQIIPSAAKLACREKKASLHEPGVIPITAIAKHPPKQAPPQALPSTGFIRQAQLTPGIVPVSHATLWRWVKSGNFPKPVKLGGNTTAWRVEDIRQWLDSKALAEVAA